MVTEPTPYTETPQLIRSVPGGTSGVRTSARDQPGLSGTVSRSAQYPQPVRGSCRKTVTAASGVVLRYQTERSYWWPGVTAGAQVSFSTAMTFRSPSVRAVSVTRTAAVPECASATTVVSPALSPQPRADQQRGKPSSTVSRSGFAIRFVAANATCPPGSPSGTT